MTRKSIFGAVAGLLALLAIAPAARAQYTTVTGTITDPNSIPYAGGTVIITLLPAGAGGLKLTITNQGQCTAAGAGTAPCKVPFTPSNARITLDSTGSFTASLPSNTSITPISTQWNFQVQIISPPPLGPNAISFSVPITITGASQSVSTTLSAAAPSLIAFTATGLGVDLTATLPIVVTPNPIIGPGVLSCPSCPTVSGTPNPNDLGVWVSSSAIKGATIPTGAIVSQDGPLGFGPTNYSQIAFHIDCSDTGGTVNALVCSTYASNGTPDVVEPSDGDMVYLEPSVTNTSATTLAMNGNAALPVLKNSATGPIALTGGELQVNYWYAAQYSDANRTWVLTGQGGSGGGGANTALSNLSAVSINTSLLAQTGVDAGSTANPFRNLFLWGTGTYGTTYEEITGAPTSTRVWTLQDATDTIVGRATTDTLTHKTYVTSATGNAFTWALPGTVSGATSGGVGCATSTTAFTTSAVLPATDLVIGGGAGACPGVGNADFTYATHTLTSGASGLVDFSAITSTSGFKVPVHATNTATAAGALDFDSTDNNLHSYLNGADAIIPGFASTPTTGHCVDVMVASGNVLFGDAGFACGPPSGCSGTFALETFCANATASAATPTATQIGLAPRAVAGATSTDTIATTDVNNVVFYRSSVAVAVALPTPTTLTLTNPFFTAVNQTTGSSTAVTLTAAGGFTFNGPTGCTTGTCAIAQGEKALVSLSPAGGVWDVTISEQALIAGTNVTITRGAFGVTVNATGTGVTSFTGDGTIITNSASTGAVTLTIAGTSGGIPCFGSTSSWKSSGILNSNIVVKGAGATNCPTNSSITDNGTTVSTTEPWTALSYTANGTTAGFVDYPQGSTSAAVAPCNVATSICEQAPTGVTSYLITKPGATPTNNFSSATTTTAGVQTFNKMAQSKVLTGAAYTNATTTFSNVASTTNLAFSLDASTAYSGSCYLVYSASLLTAGPKIEFTGPASPTAVLYSTQFQLTASPTYADSAAASSFSTSQTGGASVTATTLLAVRIQFGIVNGTNAGTLQLLAAANGAGTVTIEPGSYCTLQ